MTLQAMTHPLAYEYKNGFFNSPQGIFNCTDILASLKGGSKTYALRAARSAVHLYFVLQSFAWEVTKDGVTTKNPCTASLGTIAKKAGLSKGAARNSMRLLEQAGLIRVCRRTCTRKSRDLNDLSGYFSSDEEAKKDIRQNNSIQTSSAIFFPDPAVILESYIEQKSNICSIQSKSKVKTRKKLVLRRKMNSGLNGRLTQPTAGPPLVE